MKLKTRLKISFCTLIVVPMILFILILLLVMNYQVTTVNNTYHIDNEDTDYESLYNPVRFFGRLAEEISTEIDTTLKEHPSNIENIDYLTDIGNRLVKKASYIVVRKADNIEFSTLPDSYDDIISMLPEYGGEAVEPHAFTYSGGDYERITRQMDFIYPNGSKGSVFVITPIKKVTPQIKSVIVKVLIVVIIILAGTSGGLTFWIYKGMVKPLAKLKEATQNIKDGNLDFTLDTSGTDEISELCLDFEEMRKRLKESAEEKVQYDKESKELISNISHDLKTPITAVKGYVEGIMDGVADTPEKMDKYIRTIYNKANDMDRLINELTFYSKIDTNKIPYTFTKINVDTYFKDCVEEIALDLEAKNIKLGYFNYTEESFQIIADAEQLKRVINNIIGNSVKYINKKEGIVNVRIKDVGDFIQVEIEDNGKGIAARDLPYIFDRFYRTDSSRNSAQGGSGIGLSIVKKIIEDHGGKIWATSKEDTGTVMCFVLRKYQEEIHYE